MNLPSNTGISSNSQYSSMRSIIGQGLGTPANKHSSYISVMRAVSTVTL
jgi:hypothetical protein